MEQDRSGPSSLDQPPFAKAQDSSNSKTALSPEGEDDARYKRTLIGDLAHSALGALPPHWREAAGERWLRRSGVPGPANEHVFQYRLCKNACGEEHPESAGLKGADLFYKRQYRQYLNSAMTAYAATATVALLGCGGKSRGRLWGRHRPLYAAMVEEADGAPPVIVLDRQIVAVPLLLPQPTGLDKAADIPRWLSGRLPMPWTYKVLAAGEPVRCWTPGARARRRSAAGALIELVDTVRHTGKLAILALHPHDPDAMGLHITLFGTQVLSPEALEAENGLETDFLTPWRKAAAAQNAVLYFFAGATEELFAHCSLNLFVKRRVENPGNVPPEAWNPSAPLELLLAKQFELFQVTVSASGLPGISPRNCDAGKAGYVARQGGKVSILMPYFTGNFIHGHAAKLWSNRQGALMIRDDHTALSLIVIRGMAYTVGHDWVRRRFPDAAAWTSTRRKQSGEPAAAPEYWFVQEVSEILQQYEPLAANALDPVRPTCTIHAAGPRITPRRPTTSKPPICLPTIRSGSTSASTWAAGRSQRRLAPPLAEGNGARLGGTPRPPRTQRRGGRCPGLKAFRLKCCKIQERPLALEKLAGRAPGSANWRCQRISCAGMRAVLPAGAARRY